MKIAINTLSVIPGKVGGAETFLVNLTENLVRIDNKNEFLFVVSRNNKKRFIFNSGNVEYLEFNLDNNSRLKRVFFEQFILPKEIKKKEVDLLINPGNTGLLYSPCKEILIIQSLHCFVYPEIFSVAKRKYLQNLTRYSCKKSQKVITVSNHTKEEIIKYTRIAPEKIDVIYEGVDYNFFHNRKRDENYVKFLSQYDIKNGYIFSPTSLYNCKNNDGLIKSFALLKKKKKILQKLIIVGIDPGNEIDKLKKLIQDLKLGGKVIYLGSISHKYMPVLYQQADLTVFLSLYETFGLPVLEAMAAGCPVLSSNRSSLPEVVGDAGILVDPFNIEEVANKMYELLTDENLRKKYIKRGLVRAKQFSWENVVKRLIQIYSNL